MNNITYGNNQTVNYTYDRFKRLKTKTSDTGTVTYGYDSKSNLALINDAPINTTIDYIYDFANRLIETISTNGFSTAYTYDKNSNISEVTSALVTGNIGKLNTTNYNFDTDNKISSIKLDDNRYVMYNYDKLSRLNNKQIKDITNTYTTTYEYIPSETHWSETTTMLKAVQNGENTDDKITYTYDDNGNIETITAGTELQIKYYYDALNQLIQEDNYKTAETIMYEYDLGGNLISKTVNEDNNDFGKIDSINGNIYQNQTIQGKNICPSQSEYWENGHYDTSGNKSNFAYRIRLKNLLKVNANTTYYLNLFNTTLSPRACYIIRAYDINGNFVRNIGALNPNTNNFMTASNEVFLGITIGDLVGQTYPSQQLFDFMVDDTIKPLICLNSELNKDFEEFIPNSPSPYYPSQIETVIEDINVNFKNKNLFDNNKIIVGKTISANGIATYSTCFRTDYIKVKSGQTYTWSGLPIRGDNSGNFLTGSGTIRMLYYSDTIDTSNYIDNIVFYSNTTNNGKYTFTVPSGVNYLIMGTNSNFGTVDNMNIFLNSEQIQLEEGTNETEYTAHQEQDYLISLKGKNLIDESKLINDSNIDLTTGRQSTIVGNRTIITDYISVKPGTQYTLTRPVATGNMGCRYYDANKNFIGTTPTIYPQNALTGKFTTPLNCYYWKFVDEANTLNKGYQLEEASTATGYEAFCDIELCKGDKIYKSNGKWYLEKNIAKRVFNGTENNWSLEATNKRIVNYTSINNNKNDGTEEGRIKDLYCNIFKPASTSQAYSNTIRFGIVGSEHALVIYTQSDIMKDLTTWKNYLAQNNMIIYYPLAEPITTEITNETLINQLSEIQYLDGSITISKEDINNQTLMSGIEINFNNEETVTNTITYQYDNPNWKDQLTSYNGKAITYDEIGNPLTYDENTYTWQNGRQLASITNGTNTYEYKYNEAGIRTEKTVNGTTTNYYLEGSKVVYEKTEENIIYYSYDESGQLIGFKYGDIQYWYIRNGQGDIIGILDNSLNQIVSYTYNSWGKITSVKDDQGNEITDPYEIGNINPYRYRGYYYDSSSGLYYLNSRYYNPEWGRFINADGILESGHELLGNNLYAYCANNPVNHVDPSGYVLGVISAIALFAKAVVITAKIVVAAVAFVATVHTVASVIKASNNNNTSKNNTTSNNKTNIQPTTASAGSPKNPFDIFKNKSNQDDAASNSGSNIKNDILSLDRRGSALKTDQYHSFPDIVDNYAGDATKYKLPNGNLYQLKGSLNGVSGRFEWITQGGNVTHRMFVPGGGINGIPIMP